MIIVFPIECCSHFKEISFVVTEDRCFVTGRQTEFQSHDFSNKLTKISNLVCFSCLFYSLFCMDVKLGLSH
jgi:hypothetical protein